MRNQHSTEEMNIVTNHHKHHDSSPVVGPPDSSAAAVAALLGRTRRPRLMRLARVNRTTSEDGGDLEEGPEDRRHLTTDRRRVSEGVTPRVPHEENSRRTLEQSVRSERLAGECGTTTLTEASAATRRPGRDGAAASVEAGLQPRRLPTILEPNSKSSAGYDFIGSSPRISPGRYRKFVSQTTTVEEEDFEEPKLVFDPDGSAVFYWTGLVSLAAIYNCWMLALRLGFPELRDENVADCIYFCDLLCDILYLLDIGVQLRTAYLVDGILVFDPKKLYNANYTSQSQFYQDIAAILPTETSLDFCADWIGLPKTTVCSAGAARLFRLLKMPTVYKFYDLADSRLSDPNRVRAIRLTFTLGIVIHWIGCIYYIVSEYEGLGSNEWVYSNDTEQQTFIKKYIRCLYWSTMTLTTIGDSNPPETDLEHVFTGLTFLSGVFIFATVVGNVGDVISNMNATRQDFQARMDQIKLYLTHRKVPAGLQLKVKKWAEYSWSRTQATDESRLLHMLPERLRAEIAVHVHLEALRKVKIFERCEYGFLCELVMKLRSQIYSPQDYICRAGEIGREMYIINHGKVEVVVVNQGTGEEVVVALLSEGNYFGEISLLRIEGSQNRRTADVRSIGYSELLCLSRKDLMVALVEYPEAKGILESQAKERIRTNLQAKKTFSVDLLPDSENDMDYRGVREREEKRRDFMEIRNMISELKQLQTSIPQQQIADLTTQCQDLKSQLGDKEKQLQSATSKVIELEEQLTRYQSMMKKKWVDSPTFHKHDSHGSLSSSVDGIPVELRNGSNRFRHRSALDQTSMRTVDTDDSESLSNFSRRRHSFWRRASVGRSRFNMSKLKKNVSEGDASSLIDRDIPPLEHITLREILRQKLVKVKNRLGLNRDRSHSTDLDCRSGCHSAPLAGGRTVQDDPSVIKMTMGRSKSEPQWNATRKWAEDVRNSLPVDMEHQENSEVEADAEDQTLELQLGSEILRVVATSRNPDTESKGCQEESEAYESDVFEDKPVEVPRIDVQSSESGLQSPFANSLRLQQSMDGVLRRARIDSSASCLSDFSRRSSLISEEGDESAGSTSDM